MTYSYTIINVDLTAPGPAPIEISWRSINDVPYKNKITGTFQADAYGFFKQPVQIILPAAGLYVIRAESCGCVFEKTVYATVTP